MTLPADLPRLPPRAAQSHKGDYGRVLVLGGSRGMAGAAALAGMAALRSGAGLVRVAVPEVVQATVAGFEPSYMTVGLPADTHGLLAAEALPDLLAQLPWATAAAIGPGLGQSAAVCELVCHVYRHAAQPLVVDADALNALAQRSDVLAQPRGPRLLTPHPGELARLTGVPVADLQRDRSTWTARFAAQWRAVVVLKGHATCISDGERTFLNPTGNPGMATGGTGDVLSGVLAALLAQGMPPLQAARLGAYVHGLAGDLAAAALGEVSLIASDLLRYLGEAFRRCATA
jgi:ADP-dependent NAD(P)H-hydrate dehydratase